MTKDFTEKYMHGLCLWFALATQKRFGGKIYLWIDRDEYYPEGFLVHAYTEILPNLYIDANGTFSDISEREDEFIYENQEILLMTPQVMKKFFPNFKVYTDAAIDDINKPVKNFLQKHMPIVELMNDKNAIYGISEIKKKTNEVITYSINKEQKTFQIDDFSKKITKHLGFKKKEGWFK